MGLVLPVKSHHTSTAPTSGYSADYGSFTVAMRDWYPTYASHELPTAGTKSDWLPRNWVFKPAVDSTVVVTMHFEPDPTTWEDDIVTGFLVDNTNRTETTICTSTTIMTNGVVCTPAFAQGTNTLTLTALHEYIPKWEFSLHMFIETFTCKSWISITQTAPPVSSSTLTTIGGL